MRWHPALSMMVVALAARGADASEVMHEAAMAGMDGAALRTLDGRLAAGEFANIDHLLIMRCGATLLERGYPHDYRSIYGTQAAKQGPLNPHGSGAYNYFDAEWHPYLHGSDLHTLQSATKSMASTVWGVAITRGDFKSPLDTPVLHYFDEGKVRNLDPRKRRMTLRHLLTMTSGFDWNEELPYDDPRNSAIGMEASDDWVQFVIDKPMAHDPGAVFAYSSGVSELLADIFLKETGQDIERYAEAHLFAPLGIARHYWKRTPMGVVDTEGGLFLSAPDLARIGQMMLQDGQWHGQRLLSSEWIRDATAAHVTVEMAKAGPGWKYGYQWWVRPHPGSARADFAARGFGGQLLFVAPQDRLVMVVNGWNILGGLPAESVAIEQTLGAVRHDASGIKCD